MSTFEKTINRIDTHYSENSYELGWRFLNCSKVVLENNPQIAFITLNPGGREIPMDQPWASCEEGNSYTNEIWGDSLRGESNLQKQIQKMFGKLAYHTGYHGTSTQLIEDSLCGYFIPFRSGRLDELPNKKEAFAFGQEIWTDILATIRPNMFICIDKDSFKHIKSLITEIYNLEVTETKSLRTGWGDYNADLVQFGIGRESIKLLRFPHLSTFKLFTSAKCNKYIDSIFSDFCDTNKKSIVTKKPEIIPNKAHKRIVNKINKGETVNQEDKKVQLIYGVPDQKAYILVEQLKNKNAIACALHTIFASCEKPIEQVRKNLNSYTLNCRKNDQSGYTKDARNKKDHYSEPSYDFLYTNNRCMSSRLEKCLSKVGDILASPWAKYIMDEISVKPEKVISFWNKTAKANNVELI